jgi:hypothetical protein
VAFDQICGLDYHPDQSMLLGNFYCYSDTGIRQVSISCDGLNDQLILNFLDVGTQKLYPETIPLESIIDMVVGNKDPIFNQYQINIKARKAQGPHSFLSLRTQSKTYGFECKNMDDFYLIRGCIHQAIKMNVLKDKYHLLDQQVKLLNETILKLKQSQSLEKPMETPQAEPLDDDIYNAMYC